MYEFFKRMVSSKSKYDKLSSDEIKAQIYKKSIDFIALSNQVARLQKNTLFDYEMSSFGNPLLQSHSEMIRVEKKIRKLEALLETRYRSGEGGTFTKFALTA